MKQFLFLLGFVSAFGWGEDSNYHLKKFDGYVGTYEMTKDGVKYLVDIESPNRGTLKVSWRGDVPKIKGAHNRMPKSFGFKTSYEASTKTITVKNSRRYSFSKTWDLTGGGQHTASTGDHYHEVHVSWHDKDDEIIKVSANLVGQGWHSTSGYWYQARCWYERDTADFYLKRVKE